MSYLPELRASLVRAAERQHRPARSTHRSGSLAIVTAVGVAIAVIALAIVLVGHRGGGPSYGHRGPAGGSGGPAPPSVPNLSAAQEKLIQQARNVTTSHDPACRPFRTLPPFRRDRPGRR